MKTKVSVKKFFPMLALLVLLLASLACGSNTPEAPKPTKENNQAQVEPSQVEPGQTEPTKAPQPTKTPEPPATATPAPVGMSRSNPFSRSELVSAPNWDIQVLEVKRGAEAWNDIQAANMFNEPAPDGFEYLLVKIHAKSTYADSDEHSISGCDFDVTGDKLINYTCSMAGVVDPEPKLNASVFSGGETEGWASYMVAQGEGNLLLIFDESFSFESDSERFIALDDGASISISSELSEIKPTDVGKERNAPAPRTEKIVTDDWELSITDVVRGDAALAMVREANQFNDPPTEGFEYIAVKLHVRYIGTEEKTEMISSVSFNSTGSAGVLYDIPTVVEPSPQLNISLYPGGEYEGWIVLQAAVGETNMSLVFSPLFDFSGKNKRFISLEP